MAILFGTNQADSINGTESADTIYGYKGDDDLNGLLGNDIIFAGLGNDVVTGGQDNDFLFGGKGNDILLGNGFFDISNTSSDFLDGGEGSDVLLGGYGSNILIGGKGNDYLRGDIFDGERVNQLTGGEAGGKGDGARDVFELGAGDNYFYLGFTSLEDTADLENGGVVLGINNYAVITDFEPGIDKLQFPNATLASNVQVNNINYNGVQGIAITVGGEGGPPNLVAILQGLDPSVGVSGDFIFA